jgi:hypothetical protein
MRVHMVSFSSVRAARSASSLGGTIDVHDKARIELRIGLIRIPPWIAENPGAAESIVARAVQVPVNPEWYAACGNKIFEVGSVCRAQYVFPVGRR